MNPRRKLGTPTIRLDSKYYKKIDQLKERFPHGAPSLLDCVSLEVEGNVLFGKGVAIKDRVVLSNHSDRPVTIADGSVIAENMVFR
jgi:UTP--glucose-1-phosphate uridylyltransferase